MVDNIQSTTGKYNTTEAQMAAKDQLFPGAEWSKGDVHKCMTQWVNNIVQTLQQDNAQMKQANEELKKSEEGQ